MHDQPLFTMVMSCCCNSIMMMNSGGCLKSLRKSLVRAPQTFFGIKNIINVERFLGNLICTPAAIRNSDNLILCFLARRRRRKMRIWTGFLRGNCCVYSQTPDFRACGAQKLFLVYFSYELKKIPKSPYELKSWETPPHPQGGSYPEPQKKEIS